jgi:hypothetical protein
MNEKFTRITLRANELVGYRAAVIACSLAEERVLCERLLGQIASLESQAVNGAHDTEVGFVPGAGAAGLAQRALEHLRAQPLRARFTREPATWTERRRTRS